jgi:DNA-binding response OmpR family regulator
MDLARTSHRGYTVGVNQFLPDLLARDTALVPAVRIDAPAATADPAARCVQVVADDPAAAAGWIEALRAEGLVTICDGRSEVPRLAVVLHVTCRLPDRLDLMRQLRSRDAAVPLMVVCRQLRDLDHVLALEMGADDVLEASTSAPVVAARLRALARRPGRIAVVAEEPDRLAFGALSLSLRERCVQLRGADIALTEGEFEVLWMLATRAGRAVSRAELLRRLRGLPYQRIDRSIDCRVYRIRAKLADRDGPGQRIRTVRNCGYLFSPAAW